MVASDLRDSLPVEKKKREDRGARKQSCLTFKTCLNTQSYQGCAAFKMAWIWF